MKSELYEALAQRLQDAGLSETACAAVDMIDAAYVIRAMQSRIEALEKDAARMDWMQENYLCADFRYGDPATEVIVIEMPKRSRFCGDLRVDIDTAMQSAQKVNRREIERKITEEDNKRLMYVDQNDDRFSL